MDGNTVAIGDVALIPCIIGTTETIKRFILALLKWIKGHEVAVPDEVWVFAVYLLGILGQSTVFMIAKGVPWQTPWDFATWAAAVVSGLNFGWLATLAYDARVKTLIQRVVG